MASSPGYYSRLVRMMKLALPLAAMALIAAVLLINDKEIFEGGLQFTDADLEALGNGLNVSSPNLSGVTSKGDVYNFYATEAVPSDLGLSSIAVDNLRGTIQLFESIRIYVTALQAEFDFTEQTMNMPKGANIHTSDGYTFWADELFADMATASLAGEGSIMGTGPMGEIESDRMKLFPGEKQGNNQGVDTENQVILLEDNVKLVFDPNKLGLE